MSIQKRIKELTFLKSYAKPDVKDKIDNLVKLYKDRKIPIYKQVETPILSLISSNKNTYKAGLKKYEDLMNKYTEAQPLTGRLTRESRRVSYNVHLIAYVQADAVVEGEETTAIKKLDKKKRTIRRSRVIDNYACLE
jgi:hypothetical protein